MGFPAGFGFRFHVRSGHFRSLFFGFWNAFMLGVWAFGATSGVLLAWSLWA